MLVLIYLFAHDYDTCLFLKTWKESKSHYKELNIGCGHLHIGILGQEYSFGSLGDALE